MLTNCWQQKADMKPPTWYHRESIFQTKDSWQITTSSLSDIYCMPSKHQYSDLMTSITWSGQSFTSSLQHLLLCQAQISQHEKKKNVECPQCKQTNPEVYNLCYQDLKFSPLPMIIWNERPDIISCSSSQAVSPLHSALLLNVFLLFPPRIPSWKSTIILG